MFKRILTPLTLVLAALAVAVPVATAGTDSGIGIPAGRDVVYAGPPVSEKTAGLYLGVQHSAPLVSEKTAGLNLVSQSSQSSAPLVSEKTAGLNLPSPSPTTVLVSTDNGFDWSDAGIGAGVVFASMLAAVAGALTLRRRHGSFAH